jgi:pimeloyl-ACP methyl ester carboxylesterase
MISEDYKYIDIDGVSIAYTERGSGQPVLFVHGFASFSYTWMKMIDFLPAKFRFITIDLKGHGYSEKICDDNLALFDHAIIIKKFINLMNLDNFILIAHSLGGTISLHALFDEQIHKKVAKLIILNSAGAIKKLHSFIDLVSASSKRSKLELSSEDILALSILEWAFYDKSKITHDTITEYGNIFRQKNAIKCLLEITKQCTLADLDSFHKKVRNITIPSLIIWGEKDDILDIEYSTLFQNELVDAELVLIPDCGHSPHEENPLETAKIIGDFISAPPETKKVSSKSEKNGKQGVDSKFDIDKENRILSAIEKMKQSTGYIENIKMRRLVDHWSLSVLFMVTVLKILQGLKKIGIKTQENGWRMLSGVFLRNEHSKFILASFRLNYHGLDNLPESQEDAKKIIINRLMDFLRSKPSCHWGLKWGLFRTKRKRIFFTDIVETKFSDDGQLSKIIPYFDNTRTTFTLLKEETVQETLDRIVKAYNDNEKQKVEDHKRAWKTLKEVRHWIRSTTGLAFAGRTELCHLVERVLDATFIKFEVLTDDPTMFTRKRFATPNMMKHRHPGFGLLNIVCRMTPDYNESDLWFQYHHVPVDGMPMQEMLRTLKAEWGEVGPVTYPALSSPEAQPEVFYFGNKLFRARVYMNFDIVLNVRKYLNSKYYVEMGGFASVSSMIIWGLAQQKQFSERKFIIPLDTILSSEQPQDRNISHIFIRPGKYFVKGNPLEGFLNFQRAYNRQMFITKQGEGESYELIELYAMIHPLVCQGAMHVIPKAVGEILGTAGLTVLKDAEMFICPLTDLQFNGFMALGNMKMPTEDGKTAGAVSICSTKNEVREYIKGAFHLVENYPDYLEIEI